MFTVDGQDADAAGSGLFHDQLAGSDEGLFIGQGNVHALFDGMQCRFDTGGTDEGRQDDACVTFIDELQQPFAAGKDSTRRADGAAQFVSGLFVDHAGPFHLMVLYLPGHGLPMGIGSDASQAEGIRMGFDDVDSLGPDGTGAA